MTRNAAAARPNRSKVFTWRFVGQMGERHDNAFKKGNGANGVIVIEPAKGTARLSPASAHYPHKYPHIDGHTIVHDVSQAVNPRRNLPSPTLLCCIDQNRPRQPRDRSSKLG
uniref:Uncharacterized protein n=1 Tax=Oryza nivara TaxID=4536 RepID=A0A0E0IP53_ORYNI